MRRLPLLLAIACLAAPLAVPAIASPAKADGVRVGTAVIDVTPAKDDPQYLVRSEKSSGEEGKLGKREAKKKEAAPSRPASRPCR